jgi:hypothetical protein
MFVYDENLFVEPWDFSAVEEKINGSSLEDVSFDETVVFSNGYKMQIKLEENKIQGILFNENGERLGVTENSSSFTNYIVKDDEDNYKVNVVPIFYIM